MAAPIDRALVAGYLLLADDSTKSTTERGRAIESLIEHVFLTVPGVTHSVRNRLNVFKSEEIDVAFWNRREPSGLYFMPNILLVESKNWDSRVGSSEVDWFVSKLRRRGQTVGVLFALKGITGDAQDISSARHVIASALQEGYSVLVIDRAEFVALTSSADVSLLLQRKLMELVVSGASI